MTVNDAHEKVKEAVEILSAIARGKCTTYEAVQELDYLCNELLDLGEVFDFINDLMRERRTVEPE